MLVILWNLFCEDSELKLFSRAAVVMMGVGGFSVDFGGQRCLFFMTRTSKKEITLSDCISLVN
jgi:hypothetical protein